MDGNTRPRTIIGLHCLIVVFIACMGISCASKSLYQEVCYLTYMETLKHRTVVINLQVPPDEVYEVLLNLVEKDPELILIRKSKDKLMVEAMKGNNYFSARVHILTNTASQLTITVDAGDETSDDELALRAVKVVLDEIDYSCELRTMDEETNQWSK